MARRSEDTLVQELIIVCNVISERDRVYDVSIENCNRWENKKPCKYYNFCGIFTDHLVFRKSPGVSSQMILLQFVIGAASSTKVTIKVVITWYNYVNTQ